MREEATRYLKECLGPNAEFRPGQWEAIESLVIRKKKLLVVQRTGWGKSWVYFIATKLLRDRREGFTIIISPLLSLMRDQLRSIQSLGLRATTINSTNRVDWPTVVDALQRDEVDVLFISPERLGNKEFREDVMPNMAQIGMFVVDEAHCISDWGHDFRPDYRRIVGIIKALPSGTPVLATTATANDRVVEDISDQLGAELEIQRGPLLRESLRMQVIRLDSRAERLAWLSEYLVNLPKSGIIYCLTTRDCEVVAKWLSGHGYAVAAYHADIPEELKPQLEDKLHRNEIKALVATVALGMGFDKPDLGFVVHYQRPGSVVAYYQQMGRAGRSLDDAIVILMNGTEDDEIQEYFIEQAFPSAEDSKNVANLLNASSGLSRDELLARTNLAYVQMERVLMLLEINGFITKEGPQYHRTAKTWQPQTLDHSLVIDKRRKELLRCRPSLHTRGASWSSSGWSLTTLMSLPVNVAPIALGRSSLQRHQRRCWVWRGPIS